MSPYMIGFIVFVIVWVALAIWATTSEGEDCGVSSIYEASGSEMSDSGSGSGGSGSGGSGS